jgi:hypothetical protein
VAERRKKLPDISPQQEQPTNLSMKPESGVGAQRANLFLIEDEDEDKDEDGKGIPL